jgi:hypothetical protein
MTSQLQVLDVVVNKPFKVRLTHLKHCLGSGLRLLWIFHQNPSSRGLKSAMCQTI